VDAALATRSPLNSPIIGKGSFMPAIEPASAFAEECVQQALRFGVPSHYLVAVAKFRSGISDGDDGDRKGPFRLTQTEWNANLTDEEFGIKDFLPEDIDMWEMQCCIYALMTLRAQNRLMDQLGRFPSVIELYEEQWPGDTVDPAKLQDALNATKALMDPAMVKVTGQAIGAATTILVDVKGPAVDSAPAIKAAANEQKFVQKAPGVMEKLIADFSLTDVQAAGALGNIGHECNGFNTMQETKPLVPGSKGGFGWAQWTGSRRDEFEEFCKTQGVSTTSDEGNYGFLKFELSKAPHKSAITEIKKTSDLKSAVRVFEAEFEKAGIKHFDRRDHWAELALAAFKAAAAQPDKLLPPAVLKLLDPDLIYRVTATAKSQKTMFWVVDQIGEQGGQVLIKRVDTGAPEIIAKDTTVFPLKDELGLPSTVKNALAAGLKPPDLPGPTVLATPLADDQDVASRLFEEAKRCDETLITRDVDGTNGGRLACAWAVNKVASIAIGKPIGGGLSTTEMGKVLKANHTEVAEAQVAKGMVIISPTQGSNVGHVGIVGEIANPPGKTLIYSNSSKRGVFSHAFTLARWKAFYGGNHLPVLFYAIKKGA
jgi:hypothetical protein